jgi:hypothetical protein
MSLVIRRGSNRARQNIRGAIDDHAYSQERQSMLFGYLRNRRALHIDRDGSCRAE